MYPFRVIRYYGRSSSASGATTGEPVCVGRSSRETCGVSADAGFRHTVPKLLQRPATREDLRWGAANFADARPRASETKRGNTRILASANRQPPQIAEIVDRFDLARAIRPFTRCMACNGMLEGVAREQVRERIPPLAAELHDEFRRCGQCGRILLGRARITGGWRAGSKSLRRVFEAQSCARRTQNLVREKKALRRSGCQRWTPRSKKRFEPVVHALVSFRRNRNDLHTWADRLDISVCRRRVEFHRRGEIHFRYDCEIGAVEDCRIFQRLVFSFGDGEQDEAEIFAEI